MPKATPKSAKPIRLEDGLAALEGIVAQMENPATTLDDSLALYKDGVELATKLAASLKETEGEVAILMEKSGKIFEECKNL